MQDKRISMKEAAALLRDGDMLALGGNTLHRAPMAFVRQLVEDGKKNLRLLKTAGAHDVDLLCAGECVASVDAGFISYETEYGLAGFYRRAVQSGAVIANEHACYTVICALRAAASGAPFMPVRGLVVSDLFRVNPAFSVVEDPFGTGPVAVVKALRPDVAVVHVHRCDAEGNAVIDGPRFEDELLSRAAKTVILTAEEILPAGSAKLGIEKAHIPGFLVSAVVHAPKGAAPCACYGKYEPDDKGLKAFAALEKPEDIRNFAVRYGRGRAYAG